jgi:hypothetical protein
VLTGRQGWLGTASLEAPVVLSLSPGGSVAWQRGAEGSQANASIDRQQVAPPHLWMLEGAVWGRGAPPALHQQELRPRVGGDWQFAACWHLDAPHLRDMPAPSPTDRHAGAGPKLERYCTALNGDQVTRSNEALCTDTQ